jgi:hypothetical protein
LIIPAVPATVVVHSMAAMFSFVPPLVHVIPSFLTTVVVLLRDSRFVGCRATTRIQRQHYLTHTEHKNKTDYRTDSFDHKLIPPGLGLNYPGANCWAGDDLLYTVRRPFLQEHENQGTSAV